jgi:uncharacterized membrane protein
MRTNRIEAFSDGVIAIIITVMVLEMKVPHGTDWNALVGVLPAFLTYVMSFVYLGIYWNNHHHMMHLCDGVNGRTLWANMHLLFWLSLVPFTTGWMGENHFAARPTALYGGVLVMAAVAYSILQATIISQQGKESQLKQAVGKDVKGKMSILLYLAAIGLSFENRWIAIALYVLVALIWLVPDRRIERHLETSTADQ